MARAKAKETLFSRICPLEAGSLAVKVSEQAALYPLSNVYRLLTMYQEYDRKIKLTGHLKMLTGRPQQALSLDPTLGLKYLVLSEFLRL